MENQHRTLKIGNSVFEWGKQTYLMGIINATPDSFSGDGLFGSSTPKSDWVDMAVERGMQQEKEGAHILDVGGESTRPGSTPLPLEDELARVIPVIKKLSTHVRIPISIDTYKSEVARRAIEAGASIINDVWGGRMDSEILRVAEGCDVPIVLMHNRSQPKNADQQEKLGGRYVGMEYDDVIDDIKRELQESIDAALAAGLSQEKIIIDPGIGFGKTVEQNLELVRRMNELLNLKYPILVGPSRKSFVGYTLNLPPTERLEGTAAAVALCIDRGADIVRVHDVDSMNRVAKLTDAIVRG